MSERPSYPKPAASAQEALEPVTLRDLINRSPEPITFEQQPRPEYYLSRLFEPTELVRCVAGNLAVTKTVRELWRTLAQYPSVCPSPMLNRRTEQPTHRRYMILRFQQSLSLDKQARRLGGMAGQQCPLTCVAFDGRSVLEGWYYCKDATRAEQAAFFDRSQTLSSDISAWQQSALARMPDGLRLTHTKEAFCKLKSVGIKEVLGLDGLVLSFSKRQVVFYFNPDAASFADRAGNNGDLPTVPGKGRSV